MLRLPVHIDQQFTDFCQQSRVYVAPIYAGHITTIAADLSPQRDPVFLLQQRLSFQDSHQLGLNGVRDLKNGFNSSPFGLAADHDRLCAPS